MGCLLGKDSSDVDVVGMNERTRFDVRSNQGSRHEYSSPIRELAALSVSTMVAIDKNLGEKVSDHLLISSTSSFNTNELDTKIKVSPDVTSQEETIEERVAIKSSSSWGQPKWFVPSLKLDIDPKRLHRAANLIDSYHIRRLSPNNKVHQLNLQYKKESRIMSIKQKRHHELSRERRKLSDPTDNLISNLRRNRASYSETNSSQGATPEKVFEPGKGVYLFGDPEQLCSNLIHGSLFEDIYHKFNNEDDHKIQGRLLCLFILSSQGSNEGEVIFELIDHSSILKLIKGKEESRHGQAGNERVGKICPLYYYMDVGALIETNIDARIREYKELRHKTIQVRESQAKMCSNNPIKDRITKTSSNIEAPKVEDNLEDEIEKTEKHEDDSETGSVESSESSSDSELSQREDNDYSSLNTKNRSRLQLKLLKHFNSVTSHWVLHLIETTIDRLEGSLRDLGVDELDRVYLVKLIPSQMSIFRSCLYLHQCSSFREFKYPFMTLKFEPRTNIRLFRREIANRRKGNSSSSDQQNVLRRLHYSIMNFKTPKLSLLSSSDQSYTKSMKEKKINNKDRNDIDTVSPIDDDMIVQKDERLAPKFMEEFEKYFDNMNKLVRVRYNPVNDIKYKLFTNEQSHFKYPSNNFIDRSKDTGSTNENVPDLHNQRSSNHTPDYKQIIRSNEDENSRIDSRATTPKNRSGDVDIDSNNVVSVGHQKAVCQYHNAQLKWAIEIKIVDEADVVPNEKMTEKSIERVEPNGTRHESRRSIVFQPESRVLSIYQAPNNLDPANSPSPSIHRDFIFMRSSKATQTTSKRKRQSNSRYPPYLLIPVRVAYANGQSQTLFELKCSKMKRYELRPDSDDAELASMIAKAKSRLKRDCGQWIYEAINMHQAKSAEHGQMNQSPSSLMKRLSISNNVTGKGSTKCNDHTGHHQLPIPSLVVASIEMHVNNLDKQIGQTSDTLYATHELDSPTRGHQSIKDPRSSCLRHSVKTKQGIEDNIEDITELKHSLRSRRHVKFKLNELPRRLNDEAPDWGDNMKIEHRHWIDDNLFISYGSDFRSSLSQSERHMIETVDKIVRLQLRNSSDKARDNNEQ